LNGFATRFPFGTPCKPLLERTLALRGGLTGEKIGDADVFIDLRPMYPSPTGD
jgi:hypothetical protein